MPDFYETELAKLDARVTELESTETAYHLKASSTLAAHLPTEVPAEVVDRTPRPNSLAPGIPILANPTVHEVAEALDSYTHASGDFAQDGDPYGINAQMTDQGFASNPLAANDAVTPADGVPDETQVVAETVEEER